MTTPAAAVYRAVLQAEPASFARTVQSSAKSIHSIDRENGNAPTPGRVWVDTKTIKEPCEPFAPTGGRPMLFSVKNTSSYSPRRNSK